VKGNQLTIHWLKFLQILSIYCLKRKYRTNFIGTKTYPYLLAEKYELRLIENSGSNVTQISVVVKVTKGETRELKLTLSVGIKDFS
jgi:hypothetical protein